MMLNRYTLSRGLCCLVAAHLIAGSPAVVLAQPAHPVDPRAIDLFTMADTHLAEGDFEGAVILAERVLQYTNPAHHRDQRGSIIQIIINASFAAGSDSDLCHLDRVLETFATEVRQTYTNPTSRNRVLGAIAEHRERVARSVDCSTQENKKQQPSPGPLRVAPRPPQARPLAEETRTGPLDTRSRAHRSVVAGGTMVAMSGVFLGGLGLSLWQFDVASRTLDDLLVTLPAESRAPTESERAAAEANLAKAVTSRKLAIGMGVSAGVLLLVGIPVLAVGLRRNLIVAPAVSARQSGVSFLGNF